LGAPKGPNIRKKKKKKKGKKKVNYFAPCKSERVKFYLKIGNRVHLFAGAIPFLRES